MKKFESNERIARWLCLLAFLFLTFNFVGCAPMIANSVFPNVIVSEANKTVARNDARIQAYQSESQSEVLARERAMARQKAALSEINGAPVQRGENETIGKDGILGGVPVIFKNYSRRNKTLRVTKAEGDLKGQSFEYIIPKSGRKITKLETGRWAARWIVDGSNTLYPEKGPDFFYVTPNPRHYDDETKTNYHGGYTLFGY
jgi:hypothetical protein